MSYNGPAPNDAALSARTRAAIEAMQAYFEARSRQAPRAECKQLERNWLSAVRRMRMGTAQ
ncbi:hypothetical protein [Plasticicumulans acidivorans]|uniref:Uncharacterized protein n=1 Tax=Plasticicumulans acidivorans TaxID=886464 RepID=A0A317MZ26_9GAMM|nr:hypothetical protein [Plasticicumulans acidivorans]PWV64893.1 hypothetical protein C7443_102547 [Plasticicumulans acidivorans]